MKLVDDPAGESPAGANCPVAAVDISGDRAGDQTVGSPDVNALNGQTQVWFALTGTQQMNIGRPFLLEMAIAIAAVMLLDLVRKDWGGWPRYVLAFPLCFAQ